MSEMVTLIGPEGTSYDPPAHGTQAYYPFRLDTAGEGREAGGPWAIRVPIEIYHHFLGPAGFRVLDVPVTEPTTEEPLQPVSEEVEKEQPKAPSPPSTRSQSPRR